MLLKKCRAILKISLVLHQFDEFIIIELECRAFRPFSHFIMSMSTGCSHSEKYTETHSSYRLSLLDEIILRT